MACYLSTELDQSLRKVPDFPKPGILFYDVSSLFLNPELMAKAYAFATALYRLKELTHIAAIDSRGFLLATPIANALGLPVILVRKKGKLPGACVEASYDLEYGSATLQACADFIPPEGRILLIDDLIATGGSMAAARKILESQGAKVVHALALIGLPFLGYEKALEGVTIQTMLDYHGE